MSDGWIKLHRDMLKWGWYSDPNTKAVFLDLLLNAQYEAGEYLGYKLKAGDVIFGRKAAAKRLGLSERNVRTAIKHLKSTSEVTIKVTNKFSIISIVKWNDYQQRDHQSDQQVTSKRPASDHIQEVKKERRKEVVGNATRLPSDFVVPDDWIEFAVREEGYSEEAARKQAQQFVDYWIAQPDAKARKKDWMATWRNWVRKEYNRPKPVARMGQGRVWG